MTAVSLSAMRLIGAHIAPSLRQVLRALRYDLVDADPRVELVRRTDLNAEEVIISFRVRRSEQA